MRTALAAALLVCSTVAFVVGQQAAPANETPQQFYMRYRASVPTARTVQQIVSSWSLANRQEFDAASAADRPGLDELKSIFATASSVKVVRGSETPATAVLDVEATVEGKPVRATVQLTREKDGWKVASGPERWH